MKKLIKVLNISFISASLLSSFLTEANATTVGTKKGDSEGHQVDELSKEYARLSQDVNKAEAILKKCKDHKKKCEDELQTAEKNLNSKQNELNALKITDKSKAADISKSKDLGADIKKIQDTIDNLKNEIGDDKSEILVTTNSLSNVMKRLTEVKTKIEDAKKEAAGIGKSKSPAASVENNQKNLESVASKRVAELKGLIEECEKLILDNVKIGNKIKAEQKKVKNLNKELKSLNKELEDKKAEVVTAKQANPPDANLVKKLSDEGEAITDKIKNKQNEINTLPTVSDYEKDLEAINDAIASSENDSNIFKYDMNLIDELKDDSMKNSEHIIKLNEELQTIKQELEACQKNHSFKKLNKIDYKHYEVLDIFYSKKENKAHKVLNSDLKLEGIYQIEDNKFILLGEEVDIERNAQNDVVGFTNKSTQNKHQPEGETPREQHQPEGETPREQHQPEEETSQKGYQPERETPRKEHFSRFSPKRSSHISKFSNSSVFDNRGSSMFSEISHTQENPTFTSHTDENPKFDENKNVNKKNIVARCNSNSLHTTEAKIGDGDTKVKICCILNSEAQFKQGFEAIEESVQCKYIEVTDSKSRNTKLYPVGKEIVRKENRFFYKK